MATTAVDICNRALLKLGAEPIAALSDSTPRARYCNELYDATKQRLLQEHPWNFAKTLVTLAVRTDAPDWKWTYWYDLPADFLNLREIDGFQIGDWEILGTTIACDQDESIKLAYTANVTEDRFTPLFEEYLALTLASELCLKLEDSASKADGLAAAAEMAGRKAKGRNALDNPPIQMSESIWITARA